MVKLDAQWYREGLFYYRRGTAREEWEGEGEREGGQRWEEGKEQPFMKGTVLAQEGVCECKVGWTEQELMES